MKILAYGEHKKRPGQITTDLRPNPNVDFICTVDHVPFPDEYFDIVVSNQVMEHNFYIENYYREAARVLKPFGFMFLHFPHKWQPYDGHTGKFFRHWFYNREGFNWQFKAYHKRIALRYFDLWIDLSPYWRQVQAVLYKNHPYRLVISQLNPRANVCFSTGANYYEKQGTKYAPGHNNGRRISKALLCVKKATG